MNTYDAIKAMEMRMFTEELFDWLYAGNGTEQETQKSVQALEKSLDSTEWAEVKAVEALCLQYAKDVVPMAFRQGTYTGFQQYFTADTEKQPYSSFIKRREAGTPHSCSAQEQQAIDGLKEKYGTLESRLPEELQPRLLELFLNWKERIDVIMRRSFYLGYRYAHITIEQVERRGASTMKIVDKKLMTEYDLGVIQLREHEER